MGHAMIIPATNNHPMTEAPLLDEAVAALERETGLRLYAAECEANTQQQLDAIITTAENAPQAQWGAITKKWATHAPVGMLIQQIQTIPMTGLLVADYINPVMAQKLRENNVQFIDTVGNAYLRQLPIFVWVTGNKHKLPQDKNPTQKKAFNAAALKIIYCVLCNEELLNAPYRTIADTAGVALGTVGDALEQLKAQGFVMGKPNAKNWKLDQRKTLLEKWLEIFHDKVQAKHHAGTFITDDPQWWKNFDIGECGGLWGGGVAAAKLTGYLKPTVADVYIPKNDMKYLLQRAKLRKPATLGIEMHMGGVVQINTLPIAQQFPTEKMTVNPLLIYADLMATDDPRMQETAQIIHEKYLKHYWRD
jgi:hypothetical protein